MRLSEFLEREVDRLVDEWAEFACTNLPAARDLSPSQLRDHARKLLLHIADDMDTPQSRHEQHDKAHGRRPDHAPPVTQTAREDADERLREGFSLSEVVAEFRALRASVVRRWRERLLRVDDDTLDDLVRFNEAVDQTLGEAVAWYEKNVGQSGASARRPA